MLHHALEFHRDMSSHDIYVRSLNLHADNCAGQNKNRFILFYLAWRVGMGLEDEITLHFLIAGHTKTNCDGSFGHIKRKLKSMDVRAPFHMFEAIRQSAKSNMEVPPTAVKWIDWKTMVSQFFQIPGTFRITKYHIFRFEKDMPGSVKVKQLSATSDWKTISILKREVCIGDLQMHFKDEHINARFVVTNVPLNEVPSAQEESRRG